VGLPAGFQAWLVSESRGLKFKAEPGVEIPASGLPDDTLRVVAGPAAKLAQLGWLKDMALKAPPFDAQVNATPGGFTLALSLPERTSMRARLFDIHGRCLAELRPAPLSEGFYRFASREFHWTGPAPAAGIHFLSLELKGKTSAFRIAKKVLLRN
jgi:hypothetical protein